MKLAGLWLLLPVGVALPCFAEEPIEPKLSEHIRKEIIAKLPSYDSKTKSGSAGDALAVETDADVLILPKIVVNEKRLPGNDPDLWLSEEKVQRKAMVAYKTSMTDFEWALNGWYIPLVSAPPSARARAAYRTAKVAAETDRLLGIIKEVEKLDPKEAALLKRELTRPPGSLPAPEH